MTRTIGCAIQFSSEINSGISRLLFNFHLVVGYTTSSTLGYQFGEASWMDSWVNFYGHYETTRTIAGVTFVYRRVAQYSTITIAGNIPLHLFNTDISPIKTYF